MRNESLPGENDEDEIERYLNARYISASEAFWRIYEFPIHSRKPAIEKLPCHLPGENVVLFREGEARQAVANGVKTPNWRLFLN